MVHPSCVEVIHATRIGVFDHLAGGLFVDASGIAVSADCWEAHTTEAEHRNLVAIAGVATARDFAIGLWQIGHLIRVLNFATRREAKDASSDARRHRSQSFTACHQLREQATIFLLNHRLSL